MKTILKLDARLLALSLVVFHPSFAPAQGTAFSYSGRLFDHGAPANGNYDMLFNAYDAPTNGNWISGPVTNAPVAVSNGVFNVVIDFGDGTFTGQRLWLEIGVRTNGDTNPYATLAPRQELLPTPYAIYSEQSGYAATAAQANTANSTANGAITAPQLNTPGAPSSGQVLSFNGTSLAWTSPTGYSDIWSASNNSVFYNAGPVGIGTSAPKGGLQVARGGLAVTGASSPYTGAGAGVFMESDSFGGALFSFDYSSYQPRPLLLNDPGGNVGIGTISPQARLHIYDPANSVSELIETGGGVNSWARMSFKDTDGQWDIGTSQYFNDDQLYFYREGASVNAFAIQPNGDAAVQGKFGIGTGAPSVALDVRGCGDYGSHRLEHWRAGDPEPPQHHRERTSVDAGKRTLRHLGPVWHFRSDGRTGADDD